MDYYQTIKNDYVHKAMYPEDPMRVDWIPKGPPQGTLTIKPKEKCAPKFVTKIEGNAVEESAKVFFEGIVDSQPNPKFAWYFEDEPIIPGHKGWEEAEIHDSRKMSTLILKYAREHHMGKYTLVATNPLGTAECNCDLIVRKKQFPPVFWQRLYNVNGDGNRRFVGEIEVGGWPVPDVYWYKVMEDGEEVEVRTRTHTENWNGNPNKYVPDSRIEVRQIDQIRHVIIFHQVSDGDSGLYRVRAVNALGEAECEAELSFDGCGGSSEDLYLPPLWKERKRLTWKDEDQRAKPFVGYKEPELTPEDLAEMRKKSGGVPLNRIMEYLASLPDYVPSDKFRNMAKLPFKAGADDRDSRPDRRGGKCSYPSKFKKGEIQHRGYKSDILGRILPVWQNKKNPNSKDSSDFHWQSVHPDLFVPNLPERCKSPDGPPIWESDEDLKKLIALLTSMGCQMPKIAEIRKTDAINKNQQKSQNSYVEVHSEEKRHMSQQMQQNFKAEKHSYALPSTQNIQTATAERQTINEKTARQIWEERLNANTAASQSTAAEFTSQFMSQMYDRKDNSSINELQNQPADRPALPPKTKIMNSPSRSLFSPTESIEAESNSTATASVKTVEFLPVKEKVKIIAAQQEEINKKEEASGTANTDKKQKGVRVLPPSPVTVRKMSVDDELFQYDQVVTRTTPVTQVMERMQTKPDSPVLQDIFTRENKFDQDYSTVDSGFTQSMASYDTKDYSQQSFQSASVQQESVTTKQEYQTWSEFSSQKETKQEALAKSAASQNIDQALDQLIAETESMVTENKFFQPETTVQSQSSHVHSSVAMQSQSSQSFSTSLKHESESKSIYESSAEECRRSFEEAELEAMALESETSKSFSKQSSLIESCSTQSFVMQEQNSRQKTSAFTSDKTSKTETESTFRTRQPLRSSSFVRSPETFLTSASSVSAPNTPMSQRRRLRINQSPKPNADQEPGVKYRDSPTSPFTPGFYRKPPEDSSKNHVFQLVRRNSSKTRMSMDRSPAASGPSTAPEGVRTSQASSKAYDGDYESEVEERK